MATGDSCSSTVLKNCVQKSVGVEVSGVLPFFPAKTRIKTSNGQNPYLNGTPGRPGIGEHVFESAFLLLGELRHSGSGAPAALPALPSEALPSEALPAQKGTGTSFTV